ncbi:MAG: SDR family oxidoreductase [Proteobacteria bacterium]|nr:SDR family oxidoreductase [Pseudomonadota bacterium]
MSLFDLTGKVAVVTGSTKGIGLAIAQRMAEHGAKVVISSRKAEVCEQVAQGIRDAGGDAVAIPCHVAHKDQLQALIDGTVAQYGGIDVLVGNAGVNPYFGPSLTMPDDAYERVMNTNVRSNFWLCNMAAPHIAKRGGGAIIIVSSIGGLRGSDKLGVYGISKAADMQLVRNVAVEWGPKNIRANCLAPGIIRTDFARALWENPAIASKRCRETPLQRLGEPDDVAGAAVFLASRAGAFISGQTLVIDGGVTCGSLTSEE